MAKEHWPALPYDAWKDTYATLHMWAQVVGKVALAQVPPLNHSWGLRVAGLGRGGFGPTRWPTDGPAGGLRLVAQSS